MNRNFTTRRISSLLLRALSAYHTDAPCQSFAEKCCGKLDGHCSTSAEVGIIGMSEIVFGGLLSFMLFNEAVGLRQLCGGILVISSGIVLALDTGQHAALPDMDVTLITQE